MKLNTNYIHLIVAITILFLSALPILSLFAAVISMGLSIFYILKSKYHYALLYLILCSAYYVEPNILSLPAVGGYLFLFILLYASFFHFYKNGFFSRLPIPTNSSSIILFFYVSIFVLLSFIFQIIFSDVLDSTHFTYFKKDMLFLITMVLFFIFAKDIKLEKIFQVFLIMTIAWLSINFILIQTGLTVISHPASPGYVITSISYDDLMGFYLYFLVSIFLFANQMKYKILALLLLGIFTFNITNIGIGGQMFFGVLALLLIYILSKKLLRYFALIASFILILTFSTNIGVSSLISENRENDIFINKLNAALLVVEFSSQLDIEEIPWSPRVRLIELINLFDQNPVNIIFGNGIGGFFTETSYKFGFHDSVNPDDDFSKEQIATSRYYTPHNIGMIILKYGLIFYLLMFLVLYKILKYSKNSLEKSILLSFWVTVFFNFGWTFRISLPFIFLLHFYIKNIDLSIIKQINLYLFSNFIRRNDANQCLYNQR